MDDDGFAEDIYSVGVWPRVSSLSSPRFNRRVAALWTGGKARKTKRLGERRLKGAARQRQTTPTTERGIALTFNEATRG